MNIQKNIRCKLIGIIVIVISLLMSAVSVQAGSYNWMSSAQQTGINSVVSGKASNNHSPTLSDPFSYYEKYFYFKVPAKTDIAITLSVRGNWMMSMSLYNNRGEYLCRQDGWSYDRSSNKTNSVIRQTVNGGEYYIRVSNVFYSNSESCSYSLRTQGKMAVSPKINRISKTSSNSARIVWNKTGKVTGYEIFRKTSGSSYKKVATVNGKTSYYINRGLKRGRNYYYIVRAYKTINGEKVYSYASSAKKIKM